MKVSFILVLVLVAFSCGGKKKKKGKTSSGGGINLKEYLKKYMRTPATQSAPKTTVKPTVKSNVLTVVVKKDFNLRGINSTQQFLQVLGLDNRPLQGPQGGNGHISSAVVFGLICKLQPTFVEIPDPLKLVPCIEVNRCSGCCLHEHLACKPTRTKKDVLAYPRYVASSLSSSAKLSMSVRAGSSLSYEWATTEVEEHLGCQCGCRDGPSSCNGRQYWDQANCQCRCLSQYTPDVLKCPEKFGVHYKHDPKTCSCKCALKDNGCGSHKKEWSVEECGCVCKKSLGSCKRLQYRDPVTCDCI